MVDSSRYFDWLEKGKKDLKGAQVQLLRELWEQSIC